MLLISAIILMIYSRVFEDELCYDVEHHERLYSQDWQEKEPMEADHH